MSPQARGGTRFELLRFEAAPAAGGLVVLQIEGTFRQSARFGRPPLLVVEPGGDAPRIELTPVRTVADGHRWEGAYAVPAEALTADARLALGIRGTLLELPPPDEPDDGQRLTTLARETNDLRRALEAAEATLADADRLRTEHAEALAAASAEHEAALAEATERLRAEHEVTLAEAHHEAERLRVEHEAALIEARRAAERPEAEHDAEAQGRAEEPLTTDMAAVIDAEARAVDAERDLKAAREGLEVLRAELADERTRSRDRLSALEDERDDALARAEALRNAAAAEGLWPTVVPEEPRFHRSDTPATPPVDPASPPIDAAAPADSGATAPDRATPPDDLTAARGDSAAAVPADRDLAPADSDATSPDDLAAPPAGADPTLAFTLADERDADVDATEPFGPIERPDAAEPEVRDLLVADAPPAHHDVPRPGPNLSPWIAVVALIVFAIVLIALLFGL